MLSLDLISSNNTTDDQPEKDSKSETSTGGEDDVTGSAECSFYDGKCGLWKCTPGWLQFFNNPKFLVISLSCFVLLQGSVATGFISVGLSSIERRYNLPSSLSAFAAISYEIGVILILPFSSYFGGRGHKPRVLGISLLTLGIGCLIFASPQYISGAYQSFNSTLSSEICTNKSNSRPICSSPLIYYYPLFIFGNMIIGFGSSTLYTVGTGFIDDSTHPRYSPIYISVFYIASVLGPAIGFGLGGFFLSVYVDPFSPTTLTSTDTQWVGAWWIGFVFAGTVSILASTQFFLYPRRIKGSREYDKLRKENQPVENQGISFEEDHNISLFKMLKEYPNYLRRILRNLTFLFATLGVTTGAFVIAGVVTFLPKYVEVQFGVSPSIASYLIGGISIPAASIGIFLGGLTLFIFKKLSVERLALMLLILTLIELIIPPVLLITCSNTRIAGVNYNYPNSTKLSNFAIRNLNESCFSNCNCETYLYQPICSEGVTYISPCLAGCTGQANSSGFYSNCSCVQDQSVTIDGKCPEMCTVTIIIAAILLFFAIVLLFYNNIPFLKLSLRCVADKDRTVALGIQSLITRIFGQLPGPLALGGIFDLNCVLWQETDCGTRGACLEYNRETLKYSFIGLLGGGIIITNIFFFLAWITWKYRKIPKEEFQKE
ncbi:solute carrier organic anion transporter family member 4A1 [Oopsacas minuta]|uniref:Solute carrier organic anion transporter family member n=1 Tax=Oopsacas minuta TaxID=111878 RepID=A0AAV7JQ55_9METZ|nr:solute carrier organic anion transporter family member 4A1 [Oopsacas minuta]